MSAATAILARPTGRLTVAIRDEHGADLALIIDAASVAEGLAAYLRSALANTSAAGAFVEGPDGRLFFVQAGHVTEARAA